MRVALHTSLALLTEYVKKLASDRNEIYEIKKVKNYISEHDPKYVTL